jgi:Rrf2 family protein
VRISAKADYAVRAAVTLAALEEGRPIKAERLSGEQDIPLNFLENILNQLKAGGIVVSHRGPDGGFRLARDPSQISVADIIRVVEGPLASVRGVRPHDLEFQGATEPLREVWVAVRANLRAVLDTVTLADVAQNQLPRNVTELAADPAAWGEPGGG